MNLAITCLATLQGYAVPSSGATYHQRMRSRTPAVSRAWKRERSGRWRASAAVLGSARLLHPVRCVLDCAHRQYLTGGLLPQCCARNCKSASLNAPGYSSIVPRAIGMQTPPAPPCIGLHHLILVLRINKHQRFVCLKNRRVFEPMST